MKIVARIHTDFPEKFGIPRQSGLADALTATVVFEPEYRNADALRGLEDFSHIWLIWQFSEAVRDNWSPTVRPPRLGGNMRMGVFATRSPFRPNPIGLSSVRLREIRYDTAQGPVLIVEGADLMDGTPIYDIKPYLPITDCHTDAKGGFSDEKSGYSLQVIFPEPLQCCLPAEKLTGLQQILSQDPRPAYQDDPAREYKLSYAGFRIVFQVEKDVLTVKKVEEE
ncbi:MAG: tRNA (N6-threonylcarbamoyladenosine(37)-N6)-methyltransferase TrmO [Ruminococcaceae bacterium]|nr:tRNA (N6-threonylcarbamoyladenosine(37)-N6)-methyltransferase TrmO [Oscillospiraceae bacterium]